MTGALIRRGGHTETRGERWEGCFSKPRGSKGRWSPGSWTRGREQAAGRGRLAHLDCGLWLLGLESECLWFQTFPRGPGLGCVPPPLPEVALLPQWRGAQCSLRSLTATAAGGAHDFLGKRGGCPTELRELFQEEPLRPLRGHLARRGPGPRSVHRRPGAAYLPISQLRAGLPFPLPPQAGEPGCFRECPGFRQPAPARLRRVLQTTPRAGSLHREAHSGTSNAPASSLQAWPPQRAASPLPLTPPLSCGVQCWLLAQPGHSSQISCDPHSEKVRELGIHKVEGNAVMNLNPSEVALRPRPAHCDVQTRPDEQIPASESPRNGGRHRERVQLPWAQPCAHGRAPDRGTNVTYAQENAQQLHP